MTAVAGLQELGRVKLSESRNALIVAVSLSVGLLPMAFPALFGRVGPTAGLFLNSGIILGGACAVLLNLGFNGVGAQGSA
jgi:NCS2 family nucleobase:cation symporter-2